MIVNERDGATALLGQQNEWIEHVRSSGMKCDRRIIRLSDPGDDTRASTGPFSALGRSTARSQFQHTQTPGGYSLYKHPVRPNAPSPSPETSQPSKPRNAASDPDRHGRGRVPRGRCHELCVESRAKHGHLVVGRKRHREIVEGLHEDLDEEALAALKVERDVPRGACSCGKCRSG